MRPTHPPAGRPESRQPAHHHRGQSTPGPAGLNTHILSLASPSDEEFLSRFGDVIDDRIAEILDELLAEREAPRQHWRLPYLVGAVGLILAALAASILLRHTPVAWLIWAATTLVCLATALVCFATARAARYPRL
jgi:hypothetical protein